MKNLTTFILGLFIAGFSFSSCSKADSSPLEEMSALNALEKKPGSTCNIPATVRMYYCPVNESYSTYLELRNKRWIYPVPYTIPENMTLTDGQKVMVSYDELEPVGTFPECYPPVRGDIMAVLINCMQ